MRLVPLATERQVGQIQPCDSVKVEQDGIFMSESLSLSSIEVDVPKNGTAGAAVLRRRERYSW